MSTSRYTDIQIYMDMRYVFKRCKGYYEYMSMVVIGDDRNVMGYDGRT